jgi:hypothetical protein
MTIVDPIAIDDWSVITFDTGASGASGLTALAPAP